MSNINLDGGERSVIRTLGFGGAQMTGKELKSRLGGIDDASLLDILKTLIVLGYISANRELRREEEVAGASFFVNPGYARDLKEAMEPKAPPSRRVRRQ